jgi:hypothetical protein
VQKKRGLKGETDTRPLLFSKRGLGCARLFFVKKKNQVLFFSLKKKRKGKYLFFNKKGIKIGVQSRGKVSRKREFKIKSV